MPGRNFTHTGCWYPEFWPSATMRTMKILIFMVANTILMHVWRALSCRSCCFLVLPGVLSGEKQRIERNYNFVDVASWFASRSDLIFMLFDPSKLDISDEFKSVRMGNFGDECDTHNTAKKQQRN